MRGKNLNVMLLAAVVVVIAFSAYVYMELSPFSQDVNNNTILNKTKFATMDFSLKYDFDSNASFYSNNSSEFFFCTKDGIKLMTSSGRQKWEMPLNMTTPVLIGNGGIVAVCELSGSEVYVFNKEGQMYSQTFQGMNILNFTVNSTGYLCVILQRGEEYETRVFDSLGANIWEWKYQLPNIYPIAASISSDNRILASCLMDVNDFLASDLVFAYLDKNEAKNYTDSIFNTKRKEEQIVGFMNFMSNNNLITISDTEVTGTLFGASISEVFNMEMPNKIDFVGYLGDKNFVLSLGDSLINKDAKKSGTIEFYNLSGELISSYELAKKATYLSTSQDAVIVGAGRSYYAINSKGKLLWQYDAISDLRQVIFLENTDTILVASSTEAVIMKRKRIGNN